MRFLTLTPVREYRWRTIHFANYIFIARTLCEGVLLNVITKRKAITVTLMLMAVGYTGAAISYSYLMGSNLDFPYLCPLCPEIFPIGPPLGQFPDPNNRDITELSDGSIMAKGYWITLSSCFKSRCTRSIR
jgi:hypothetical protein